MSALVVGDCYDIEQAIYQRFTGPDRKFAKVDLGRFTGSLRPGLNVAVLSGKAGVATTSKYKEEISIVLLIHVENLASEMQRRRLMHPLRIYAVRLLVGTRLSFVGEDGTAHDLGIDAITYDGWNEKTTIEQFNLGQMVIEVRFKTAYEFPSSPPDVGSDVLLESLLVGYHLVDPATGEMSSSPVLESEITLET